MDAAIAEHMADPSFGVSPLAEALGLSTRQLRRKLAALTDTTPGDRIRRARVHRAAAMITDEGASVKEAQWAVGFASASGLRTAFHAVKGIAPTELDPGDPLA